MRAEVDTHDEGRHERQVLALLKRRLRILRGRRPPAWRACGER
jgi:hypothetical protein